MKSILQSLVLISIPAVFAGAQVAPAARGGDNGLPVNTGDLHYALRYSESAIFGTNEDTEQTSTLSGSADYTNKSERAPFSVDYAGGYTWTLSGPDYLSGLFQHLSLSQAIVSHKSKFLVSDSVEYLPESPITGFSGIPGVGEPIGTPNPTPSSGQTILTLNTHAVENFASGEFDHSINYSSGINVGGSSELLRYPNGDGLDASGQSADAGYTRRLNSRTSLMASYLFTQYTYPGYSFSFTTNTALAGVRRQWSRSLSMDVSAGPLWIGSSNSAQVPSSTNFATNASLMYQRRYTGAGVTFTHGTNGGAGYLFGGEITSITGNFTREFGRNVNLGLAGGYARTSGLNGTGTNAAGNSVGATNAVFGEAQVIWQISRQFILFANYTDIDQSSTSALPSNALTHMMNIASFGIGYSPRQRRTR